MSNDSLPTSVDYEAVMAALRSVGVVGPRTVRVEITTAKVVVTQQRSDPRGGPLVTDAGEVAHVTTEIALAFTSPDTPEVTP